MEDAATDVKGGKTRPRPEYHEGELTLHDYFEAAYRNPRPRNGASGATVRGQDGLQAAFIIKISGNRLTGAAYHCSTCVTLVALCEHLAGLIAGRTVSEARRWTAGDLLAMHPEIPPERLDRAHLAIAALRAALPGSDNRGQP